MGLADFFKKFYLKRQLILHFDSFFNKQKKKHNTCDYLDDIPEETKNLYSQIKNISLYNDRVNTYELYESGYKKYNAELDELYNKAKAFSLSSIIKDPTKYDYSEIINCNEEVVNKLSRYNKLDAQMQTYLSDYKTFKKDFELIKKEFVAFNSIKSLAKECDEIYLDDDLVKLFYEKYKKIIEDIPAKSKDYYNLCLPKDLENVDEHNKFYISTNINDTIFNDVNGRSLDKEQRIAVLTDSKANLTVAGAGSGKTLTICGKIKYLLNKRNVNPNDILLLSYSKKSAEDLKEKIQNINKDIRVNTFHSLGLDILSKAYNTKYAVDDSFEAVVEKFFRNELPSFPEMQFKVLNYYGLYLSPCDETKQYANKGEFYEDIKSNDFRTLKDQLQNYNQSNTKLVTIKKENVKSFEELAIANFLFINGIDYEYESTYKEAKTSSSERRQYLPDFYLPKYHLYYEHFGIDRNEKCPQYTGEEATEYVETMKWKRELHANNCTKCIETYSYEFQEGTIFKNLEERLKKNGVVFSPLKKNEITNAIDSIYSGQSFKSFIKLILTFISLYKSKYENGETFDKFKDSFGYSLYEKERVALFLDICKNIYSYYMEHLKKEDKIDFDDMILKSCNILPTIEGFSYKYIIVDEFQDISYSRMKLLKKLVDKGNSKLFAVGDDWQAIYRFAGCDINLFLDFDKFFKGSQKCFITSTHRNSQELQNVAESFITANPDQIKKNVKSVISLNKPIKIMYFDDNKFFAFYNVLKDISLKNEKAQVMLIGRNNKDIELLESDRFYREKMLSDRFISKDFPQMDIRFTTAHASKGLESEFVVIINADDSKQGFPNKIEDDPMLNMVLSLNSKYDYAEERRLWYVALTRTKTYTYILANLDYPSIFVKEIERKCEIINSEKLEHKLNPILCPNCKSGRLIIRDNKVDGTRFFGCSNYPYCNYTNNNIKMVNTNHRCKTCGDFMEVRKGTHGLFWGCNKYPKCRYTEEYIPKGQEKNPIGFRF